MTPAYRAIRRFFGGLPFIGAAARRLKKLVMPRAQFVFRTSYQYLDDRYKRGGNSGAGSYGLLARFKADVLNQFVKENSIQSVIEIGCGDGSQLALAHYPEYVGLDVSIQAIEICQSKFRNDSKKRFFHASDKQGRLAIAELAISLDVIYHLVEDDVFNAYMQKLVASAEKYVCIYSSNFDDLTPAAHVRHRCFDGWMQQHAPSFSLISKIQNPYPHDNDRPNETSWSDFYFFERRYLLDDNTEQEMQGR